MSDKKVVELVEKCEAILARVEAHAAEIKTMHDHMEQLVAYNKKLEQGLVEAQQQDMQKQLIKLAKKAAKKAAQKSITKAQIRERLSEENNLDTGD